MTTSMNPWNVIYKIAAGKTKKAITLTTILKQDGSFTSTAEDTLDVMMDKCVPKDTVPDNEIHTKMRHDIENYVSSIDDSLFTDQEVTNAIKSFKEGKTPGADGFTRTIVERFFTTFPLGLTAFYNKCLLKAYFPRLWKHSRLILLVKPGKEDRLDVQGLNNHSETINITEHL